MEKTIRNLIVISSCTGYCGRVRGENGTEYNIMMASFFPPKEGDKIEVDVYKGWNPLRALNRKGVMHSDKECWLVEEIRVVK